MAEGVYTWTVAAYDEADNTSAYASAWSLTIDDTSPQIDSVSPVSGATGVSLDESVVVTFDESVDTATFLYAVVPNPGGWDVTWGMGDTTVTMNHALFDSATTYTVTITAAADLASNSLSGVPVAWQFTTEFYVYLPLVLRNY